MSSSPVNITVNLPLMQPSWARHVNMRLMELAPNNTPSAAGEAATENTRYSFKNVPLIFMNPQVERLIDDGHYDLLEVVPLPGQDILVTIKAVRE